MQAFVLWTSHFEILGHVCGLAHGFDSQKVFVYTDGKSSCKILWPVRKHLFVLGLVHVFIRSCAKKVGQQVFFGSFDRLQQFPRHPKKHESRLVLDFHVFQGLPESICLVQLFCPIPISDMIMR